MKTISTDTRTLPPGANGDGSFTEKNFPLEERTGKSREISPREQSDPTPVRSPAAGNSSGILCRAYGVQ